MQEAAMGKDRTKTQGWPPSHMTYDKCPSVISVTPNRTRLRKYLMGDRITVMVSCATLVASGNWAIAFTIFFCNSSSYWSGAYVIYDKVNGSSPIVMVSTSEFVMLLVVSRLAMVNETFTKQHSCSVCLFVSHPTGLSRLVYVKHTLIEKLRVDRWDIAVCGVVQKFGHRWTDKNIGSRPWKTIVSWSECWGKEAESAIQKTTGAEI